MKTLNLFSHKSPIKAVFTDIDDTLTHNGKLGPEAYQALWRLKDAGFQVVPVTGRPAGWCELIARLWPVAGVIGENGGLYYRLVNANGAQSMQRRYALDSKQIEDNRRALEAIRADVLTSVPRAQVASDQMSRMFDLAIDFAEDVIPPLKKSEIEMIVNCFERKGAIAKVSSIHVNGWFGDYNKLSMTKIFASEALGLDWSTVLGEAVFVGDSPNDEPMFEAFPMSFAVANIKAFSDRLQHRPAYVTQKEGGLGFVEVADLLIHHNQSLT